MKRVKLDTCTVGDIVELNDGEHGIIRFIGEIKGETGVYYGIDCNESPGNTDGSWNNIYYFTARPYCGIFVKRTEINCLLEENEYNLPRVTVGDIIGIKNKNCNAIIRFIGWTLFHPEIIWYGVQLEKPVNDGNNGTVEDRTYFTCADKYGLFVMCNHISNRIDKKNKKKGKKKKTKRKNKKKKAIKSKKKKDQHLIKFGMGSNMNLDNFISEALQWGTNNWKGFTEEWKYRDVLKMLPKYRSVIDTVLKNTLNPKDHSIAYSYLLGFKSTEKLEDPNQIINFMKLVRSFIKKADASQISLFPRPFTDALRVYVNYMHYHENFYLEVVNTFFCFYSEMYKDINKEIVELILKYCQKGSNAKPQNMKEFCVNMFDDEIQDLHDYILDDNEFTDNILNKFSMNELAYLKTALQYRQIIMNELESCISGPTNYKTKHRTKNNVTFDERVVVRYAPLYCPSRVIWSELNEEEEMKEAMDKDHQSATKRVISYIQIYSQCSIPTDIQSMIINYYQKSQFNQNICLLDLWFRTKRASMYYPRIECN